MSEIEGREQDAEDRTLVQDVKMIVGGVATIVLLVVPVILVRHIVKRIENSEAYKNVENALG